jgi:signal peptidase I
MRPSLLEGDVVFVNRLAYDIKVPLSGNILKHLADPQRGDVVTFSSPKDGTRLIKRIAAVAGDRVEMRNKLLIINGQAAHYQPITIHAEQIDATHQTSALQLSEKFGAQSHQIQWLAGVSAKDQFGPLTIPADQYLMLGDNRDNSADSRFIGLVSREQLIGKASFILASANITGNWLPRASRFGMSIE